MRAWVERLQFAKPLQEVRLVAPAATPERARELQAVKEEAFEQGRREGEKALSEQLVRQRSELLQLQNGVLQSLRQLLPELTQQYEGALVSLALEAAQKVVAGLPISVEMVEATVREALERVDATSEFTVLLHAADLDVLQRANAPLLIGEIGGQRIQIRSSPDVTPGGCIVQTRFGTIDGRRETKLQLLKSSLER